MTIYLAIDFGTTNCVAGEVSAQLSLELVPLEENSAEMPSAIFLKSSYTSNNIFDEFEYQRRVKKAMEFEFEKNRRLLENIEGQINVFFTLNKPRLRDPNRNYSSFERKNYKFVESSLFDVSTEYFKNNDMVLERKRLMAHLPPPKSETEIRNDVKALMLSEVMDSNVQILKEETFFTALNDPDIIPIIGENAINEYTKNPMSGFFMRSPKAFLAANLNSGQKELFTKAVFLILKHIKVKAEKHLDKIFDGVVIGRPVNFMGANNSSQNDQAIDILKTAAIRSGFKSVRFVQEPLAAALVLPQSIYSSSQPALVIDVGGGTTDIAYLDVVTEGEPKLSVEGISGERTGGNDFDQSIALNKFGKHIGRNNSKLNSVIVDAFSTRDIHSQSRFRNSGDLIYQTLKKELDNAEYSRLYHLYINQLQHQLLLSAEKIKVNLSTNSITNLEINFLPPDFEISLTNDEINSICSNHLEIIRKNINQAIPVSRSLVPVRVFLTGGMSSFLPIVNLVREIIPNGSSVRRISALQSIVAGLAVVARQLSFSESIYDEPNTVRGIIINK